MTSLRPVRMRKVPSRRSCQIARDRSTRRSPQTRPLPGTCCGPNRTAGPKAWPRPRIRASAWSTISSKPRGALYDGRPSDYWSFPFGTDQLLRLFKGVQAMRVSGADISRYDLRVTAPRSPEAGTPDPSVLGHDREAGSVTAVGLESHRQQESIRYQIRGVEAARMWLLWRSIP